MREPEGGEGSRALIFLRVSQGMSSGFLDIFTKFSVSYL